MSDTPAPGLLAELTVVELATVLAGPAVGQFFAELGARVIKVEPPGGDVTRGWRLAGETEQPGSYYAAVNWGKTVLKLDLKSAEGRAALHALVARADIVISNARPADAERLGADPDTLRALNPRLIYARLTGYGADDSRGGYDAVVQAEAGFLHLNGQADGPPTKMPVALIDLLAAHQLKQAILLGLLHRQRTGQGALVEADLLRVGLSSLANQSSAVLWSGAAPGRIGSEHPSIVPYGTVFATAEGAELLLAVGSDGQFAALCGVLGAPTLAADPRYATNAQRVVHRAALLAALRPLIAAWAVESLLTALVAAGVPVGRVNSVNAALALPQAEALLLRDAAGRARGLRTLAAQLPEGWVRDGLEEPR